MDGKSTSLNAVTADALSPFSAHMRRVQPSGNDAWPQEIVQGACMELVNFRKCFANSYDSNDVNELTSHQQWSHQHHKCVEKNTNEYK